MKTALLIIDMQNDFIPGGSLPVASGDEIIPIINELQKGYELIVATQDWHPADHGSFASQHPGAKTFEMAELAGLPQVLWPDHCVQGTYGAELSTALDLKHIAAIFRKGMDTAIDSYSAFFDNGHMKATGLEGYLRGLGIKELHICGLAADYCVFYSAMDALNLGFKVSIIDKATKAINPEGYAKAQQELMNSGGKII
ncbi:MAG TPA: bifunctional nicotinamidase/pyrazinamidase [Anaerolineaceae bacterium]|nr:bifunctional nicotinamidase/pyrazinamidase [Anaerolineaceae bacterium]